MQKKSKIAIYTFLTLFIVAGVFTFSHQDINFSEQEENPVFSRRNLGEYKDKYCKGLFFEVEATDPNGNKYKSQQLVTDEQRDEAASVRSKLQMARKKEKSKDKIKNMVNENDYMGYAQSLLYVAAPFIVLFGLGSIGSCFYMFCFFLEKYCCKRDLQKHPYTDSDLGRPATCVFFFGLCAIGCIAYGYSIAREFKNMNSVMTCALVSVMDEVVYGETVGTFEWLGLEKADQPIQDIIVELDTVAEKQDLRFSNTAWINQELEDLDNTNQGIYDYYTGKDVPDSPNPAKANATESDYITEKLGPLSEPFTLTHDIQLQLNLTTRKFAEAVLNTEQTSSEIKLNVDSIKDVLTQGRKNIRASANQFKDTIEKMEKKLDETEGKNELFNTGLQLFFGSQLVGATLAFLGVSLTHCTGPRPKCRVLLHIGWFIMSVMMCLGLFMTCFMMPIGVMLTETCSWMDDFLKDKNEFDDPTYTFLPREIMTKMSECRFGTGNLNEEFGIDQEMGMITNMLAAVDISLGLQDSNSKDFIDLSQATQVIEQKLQEIEALKIGYVFDSKKTDDDNPRIALENLNKWADHTLDGSWQKLPQVGNCEVTQDEYVFHRDNCTHSTIYDSALAADQNYGQETCIQIKDLILLEQATRYAKLTTEGCDSQVESKLRQYFYSLYKYDMGKTAFFGSIQADVQELKDKIDAYHTRLTSFIATTTAFKDDVQGLINSTTDPETGLMSRFNCKFLDKSMDRIFDAMCVNYVTPVFKGIIATAVSSTCMLFASFFSFCLSIRYARKVRPQKVLKQTLKKNKKNLQKDRVRGVKKERKKPKMDKKDSLQGLKKKTVLKPSPLKKKPQVKKNGKKVKRPVDYY